MTVAVCFKCGNTKTGAFVPCPVCGARPQTEDELALSFAMTDWHFDLSALQKMGERIANGHPQTLDPKAREHFINKIRKDGLAATLNWLNEVSKETEAERHNHFPWCERSDLSLGVNLLKDLFRDAGKDLKLPDWVWNDHTIPSRLLVIQFKRAHYTISWPLAIERGGHSLGSRQSQPLEHATGMDSRLPGITSRFFGIVTPAKSWPS